MPTYLSSDSLLEQNKRDITDNAFTGAVTITDETTTSTLEQVTAPAEIETGLRVSGNLLVGEKVFIGNGNGGQILANLSTDTFQLNLNTPQNGNGLLDCNLGKVFLTSDSNSSNKIILSYDSATRASLLDGSTFDKIGDIAYTSDIPAPTNTFADSINITKTGSSNVTLENNGEGLAVKSNVDGTYLDNRIFLDNIVLQNILPGPNAGGGNITLCQYPGAGGFEGLIILGPQGLHNQLDVRNIQTRGVNFTDQQPNSYSKRFLYWDGSQDMIRLINGNYKLANLIDTLQIIYSDVFTGTTWASLLQTAVYTAMENQKIMVLDPQSNNETFALTTPYNTLAEYGRIRFINISSQNHSARLQIFSDNVDISPGDVLTVVKGYASNTYKTFVGV